MPFSRRLAIAIEEQGDRTPFLSQKALKHVLVGVEKLVKTLAEQSKMQSQAIDHSEILRFVNDEREKCGLVRSTELLTVGEVQARDADLFRILDNDVASILAYIHDAQVSLAASISEWLDEAQNAGVLFDDIRLRSSGSGLSATDLSDYALTQLVKSPEFMESAVYLARQLLPIEEYLRGINDHVELNVAAIKKILKRHELHVPEDIKFCHDFKGFDRLRTQMIADCLLTTRTMRTVLEDIFERSATSSTIISPRLVESLAIALGGCKL